MSTLDSLMTILVSDVHFIYCLSDVFWISCIWMSKLERFLLISSNMFSYLFTFFPFSGIWIIHWFSYFTEFQISQILSLFKMFFIYFCLWTIDLQVLKFFCFVQTNDKSFNCILKLLNFFFFSNSRSSAWLLFQIFMSSFISWIGVEVYLCWFSTLF